MYDYGDTQVDFNLNPTTAVDDIIGAFEEISKLRNRFISSANVKELFGKLILLYKTLDEEQKNVVLLKWATDYYVDGTVLKKKMSQDINDFKSLAIVVNDLKVAIEPKYMWIFRKFSTLKKLITI